MIIFIASSNRQNPVWANFEECSEWFSKYLKKVQEFIDNNSTKIAQQIELVKTTEKKRQLNFFKKGSPEINICFLQSFIEFSNITIKLNKCFKKKSFIQVLKLYVNQKYAWNTYNEPIVDKKKFQESFVKFCKNYDKENSSEDFLKFFSRINNRNNEIKERCLEKAFECFKVIIGNFKCSMMTFEAYKEILDHAFYLFIKKKRTITKSDKEEWKQTSSLIWISNSKTKDISEELSKGWEILEKKALEEIREENQQLLEKINYAFNANDQEVKNPEKDPSDTERKVQILRSCSKFKKFFLKAFINLFPLSNFFANQYQKYFHVNDFKHFFKIFIEENSFWNNNEPIVDKTKFQESFLEFIKKYEHEDKRINLLKNAENFVKVFFETKKEDQDDFLKTVFNFHYVTINRFKDSEKKLKECFGIIENTLQDPYNEKTYTEDKFNKIVFYILKLISKSSNQSILLVQDLYLESNHQEADQFPDKTIRKLKLLTDCLFLNKLFLKAFIHLFKLYCFVGNGKNNCFKIRDFKEFFKIFIEEDSFWNNNEPIADKTKFQESFLEFIKKYQLNIKKEEISPNNVSNKLINEIFFEQQNTKQQKSSLNKIFCFHTLIITNFKQFLKTKIDQYQKFRECVLTFYVDQKNQHCQEDQNPYTIEELNKILDLIWEEGSYQGSTLSQKQKQCHIKVKEELQVKQEEDYI